ncbi:MAG TPA: ABC transporter permease [Solirubrobacteraceae bacterium]|nr:ABC transporter permease [Solirubrobacteraceae bacterium]
MTSLLRKDLLILGRSRLLLVLLVVYPVVIAVLIGLALSRGPSRARVAIVDETPPGEVIHLGGERLEVDHYAHELLTQSDTVEASSRADAIAKVKSGDVLAAIVIPPNFASSIASGSARAPVEVVYNGNALEQSLVRSEIESDIAKGNLAFSEQIQRVAASAIEGLLRGGSLKEIGIAHLPIGLAAIPPTLDRIIARQPPGHTRTQLRQIDEVARFASENLDSSRRVLAAIGQPIAVKNRLLHGRRTPLNRFAVVVAVSISLMLVGVLLAAGSVALEREEGVLARLLRGLVSRWMLISEKVLLAAVCAFVLGLALLAGIGSFVALEWSRAGQWVIALAGAALAFAAVGVAIGVLAKEVRAASLLALLATLPLAFLALVPAGSVSGLLDHVIDVIAFVFPFRSALQALDCAVNDTGPRLWVSLVHLLGLTVAYGLIARAGLARARASL